MSVAANPSHLEAVDPVLEGIARAKQDVLNRGVEYPVLPLLVHGDAAFAGQGVVAETLNLGALPGVQDVIRISQPFKLVSRESHPVPSTVLVGGVPIGPDGPPDHQPERCAGPPAGVGPGPGPRTDGYAGESRDRRAVGQLDCKDERR